MITNFIGQPRNRVDGRAKVTGAARYAAEYNAPDLAHGVVVLSAIARGKIQRLDASGALKLDGVLHVFTHENLPPLPHSPKNYRDSIAPPGKPFQPFGSDEILFSAQPIALVVAESLELAHYAASLVRVEYKPREHLTDLDHERSKARTPAERDGMGPPEQRGTADKALSKAAVQVDVEYKAPVEHHNPMEMFATTVVHDDNGTLTVYDKTQGVGNVHNYLCKIFGCEDEELRVMSPFVGGAFGSGLRPQYQVFLAVLAARELKRSVRVALTRQQMFSFGHRPATLQRVALGASNEGKLESVIHEAISETSRFEDYSEMVVNGSGMLYQCGNARFDHQVVPLGRLHAA